MENSSFIFGKNYKLKIMDDIFCDVELKENLLYLKRKRLVQGMLS